MLKFNSLSKKKKKKNIFKKIIKKIELFIVKMLVNMENNAIWLDADEATHVIYTTKSKYLN